MDETFVSFTRLERATPINGARLVTQTGCRVKSEPGNRPVWTVRSRCQSSDMIVPMRNFAPSGVLCSIAATIIGLAGVIFVGQAQWIWLCLIGSGAMGAIAFAFMLPGKHEPNHDQGSSDSDHHLS
jgi:hypothetical protein